MGGAFILRIEDTDRKRLVAGAREEIEANLKLFGITWDEYYVQSERATEGIYREAADKLVEEGRAFYCQCAAKNAKEKGYTKELRDPCREKNLKEGAVKLKVPDGEEVSFVDFVLHKEVVWKTSEVADTTLLKSDGFPTYHLAVVVDDHEMKITHALRGHDWMPSTPVHLLVYKYLGYDLPQIGHLTDILDPEGGKLSKRKGSVSVPGMLAEGYLPAAILNFVMLLGWAPKDNREIFSLEEFVGVFDVGGLQKSNPVFNKQKLEWFNKQYIARMGDDELAEALTDFWGGKGWDSEKVKASVPLTKTRITKLSEYEELCRFLFERVEAEKGLLGKSDGEHLAAALTALEKVDWNLEAVNKALMKVIEEKGFAVGKFFMSLRIAVAGRRISPPLNESMVILGKKETLERIKQAL
jgi:glutamyl-tRNA synthetase